MSQFNAFAKELDTLARNTFSNIQKLETNFEKAEQARKAAPIIHVGISTAEYAAKAARAEADYQEAKKAREDYKVALEREVMPAVTNIRGRLDQELNRVYSVDPSQVDAMSLELLKSGIMRIDDYMTMLYKAESENNATMARLIGKYAKEAAVEEAKNNGSNSLDASRLRVLAEQASTISGKNYVEAFEFLVTTFTRCVNNPRLISMWDEFTSERIQSF